jgi:hypothetical protein
VFAFVLCSPGTMNPTKRLNCICGKCGGSIQFQAELVGTMTHCPLWTVIAVVILALGVIVPVAGLKHFEQLVARQKDRAAAAPGTNEAATAAGFEVSAFSLEKGPDSSGMSAVGTVVNTSNRARSRVTLELDLLDAGGRKVGIVRGYRPLLEPGAKWQVKLSVEGAAGGVSARVASIKEGQ